MPDNNGNGVNSTSGEPEVSEVDVLGVAERTVLLGKIDDLKTKLANERTNSEELRGQLKSDAARSRLKVLDDVTIPGLLTEIGFAEQRLETLNASRETELTAFKVEKARLNARAEAQSKTQDKAEQSINRLSEMTGKLLGAIPTLTHTMKICAALIGITVVGLVLYFAYAKASPNRDVLAAVAELKTELGAIRSGVVTPEGKTVAGMSASIDLRLAELERDKATQSVKNQYKGAPPDGPVDVASFLKQIQDLQAENKELRANPNIQNWKGGPVDIDALMKKTEELQTQVNRQFLSVSSPFSLVIPSGKILSNMTCRFTHWDGPEKYFGAIEIMDVLRGEPLVIADEREPDPTRSNLRVYQNPKGGKPIYIDDYLNSLPTVLDYFSRNCSVKEPVIFMFDVSIPKSEKGADETWGLFIEWNPTEKKLHEVCPKC